MSEDIGNLNVRITADTTGLESGASRARDAMGRASKNVSQNAERISSSFRRASSGFSDSSRRMATGFRRISKESQAAVPPVSQLTGAIGGLAGALSVREVIRYSDAWQNAANQLRQVTDSTSELEDMQLRLMGVANDTRADFTATANLYARLARSTTELGISQEQLVGITQTINQSFAVSGATAEEAGAAITQLSQGLAAGALRGDEFNSVAEQAPGIMRAIAESLDMTIGNLRDFAAEGGITAEIVIDALTKASDTIDNEFGRSVATFGQQMTVARNNMREFIGTSSEVESALSGAGDAIVMLSENMDGVVQAGQVAAGLFAGRLVGSMAAATSGMTAASFAANGLRTSLAFLGGPIGLLVGAGGLLFAFRDELGLVPRSANQANEVLANLGDTMDGVGESAVNNNLDILIADLEATSLQAQETAARLTDLEARQRFYSDSHLGVADSAKQAAEQERALLEQQQSRINELTDAIAKQRAYRQEIRSGKDSEESRTSAVKSSEEAQEKLTKTLDSAMGSFRALREEFAPGTEAMVVFNEEQERMQMLLNNGRISSKEFAAAVEQLREQMKEGLMGGEFEGFAPGFMLTEEELELLRERLQMRQEILEEFREIDVERESEMYAARLERLKKALENEAITEAEYYQGAQEAERDHWNKISSTRQQALRNLAQMVGDSYGEQAGLAANALAQIVNATATHSERAFKIQKAAAIASAIVSTYQGVAKTLATYPWPIAGVLASAHLATGLAQVAQIRSQSFSGGTSSGGSGGGGTVSAGGGGGAAQAQQAQQPAAPQGGTLTVQGISSSALFTGDAVRELAEELISYQKRGGTIVVE